MSSCFLFRAFIGGYWIFSSHSTFSSLVRRWSPHLTEGDEGIKAWSFFFTLSHSKNSEESVEIDSSMSQSIISCVSELTDWCSVSSNRFRWLYSLLSVVRCFFSLLSVFRVIGIAWWIRRLVHQIYSLYSRRRNISRNNWTCYYHWRNSALMKTRNSSVCFTRK